MPCHVTEWAMGRRYVMRLRRPRFKGTWTPFVTPRQSIRRLVWLGLVASVLVMTIWAATTQTVGGQRVADLILYGRAGADADVLVAAWDTLAMVSVVSAALAGLGLVTLALAEGGVRHALAVVVILIGANMTTQGLKVVLGRPNFLGDAAYAVGNSFPSGHVTVVASLGLAFVLVAPRRVRTPAAIAAAILIGAVGVSTIAAGWHRLADVAGAVLISLAWASLVTGILVRGQGWMPRRTWGRGLGGRVTTLAAAVGWVAVITGAAGVAVSLSDPTPLDGVIATDPLAVWTFVAAVAITAGVSLLAPASYVWAMRGVAFEQAG